MLSGIKIPDDGFKTIVVDPPWPYGKWGKGSAKCALSGSPHNISMGGLKHDRSPNFYCIDFLILLCFSRCSASDSLLHSENPESGGENERAHRQDTFYFGKGGKTWS